jgi:hypothetical protein
MTTSQRYLSRFFKNLLKLVRSLKRMHTLKSGYATLMKIRSIASMWSKVCNIHDLWCNDPHGYLHIADAMMGRFARLISQCFDAIRQGVWVFFYEQETWCLLIQSSALSSLVITSMVSYAIFRTQFLHRIWYCS